MMPPQNATSTKTLSEAALNFSAKFSLVVVGGIEFLNTIKPFRNYTAIGNCINIYKGMSTIVVTPPAAAALVAVVKPSL